MMKGFQFSFAALIISTAIISLYRCKCPTQEVTEVDILGPMPFPEDNPNNSEKVSLGRQLFFDRRLSIDNSFSCATCHLIEKALTDNNAVSIGVEGRKGFRNVPTLLNIGYSPTLMLDGEVPSLEMQSLSPIQAHDEMAISMGELIDRLAKDESYETQAKKVFGRSFDAYVLTRSLAAFQRTLISDSSRFDQWYYHGNETVLNESEKRGWKIFSEKLYCLECHNLPHFTSFTVRNNGYTYIDSVDQGRFRVTVDSNDIGSFKVPTLRNIELTYPYMHNGSLSTLNEVIDHYQNGGGGYPYQDPKIKKFNISEEEKEDLISFLKTLTDTSYTKKLQQ